MKFRVHFEASAAVGIEIEVEAEDEDKAKHTAECLFNEGKLMLNDCVDELIKPDPIATEAYAKATERPIKYVTVELDEAGFEVVDTFEPEE